MDGAVDLGVSPSPGRQPGMIKRPTGIAGLDEISSGGLPVGRLIALTGRPGTGKTVIALQTLVNRARLFGEAGIFVTFEEPVHRLRENAASFDWDFAELDGSKIIIFDGRLALDTVLGGEFDLGGILAQLGVMVEQMDARTVVFDGLSMLISCLPDIEQERRELLRIDHWLLGRQLSCILTGKHSAGVQRDIMREEYLHYLTDVLIEFGGEIRGGAFSRTLRIVKYRGSSFATNAFPTVITPNGIQVIAKPAARLSYPTFLERLSSGVAGLDELLQGGYWRGTTVLVSGAPGTAKTNLAGHFVAAACGRGEKVLYVSFDESDTQITHDLRTVGIDLDPYRQAEALTFASLRAASRSPEEHYAELSALMAVLRPTCLVIDPISSLVKSIYPFAEQVCEVLLDEARSLGVTTFCTSLSGIAVTDQELSVSSLSTIADTWIHLTFNNRGGERNRAITIIKSRGTAHSNQVRELLLSERGLELVEVYAAEGEVLMGSARAQKEQADRERELEEQQSVAEKEFALRESLATTEMQFEALRAQLLWKRQEVDLLQTAANARAEHSRRATTERLRRRGEHASRSDVADGRT